MWADDLVLSRDGKWQHTGQESDSTLERSLTGVWEDRGGGNNIFITINDK